MLHHLNSIFFYSNINREGITLKIAVSANLRVKTLILTFVAGSVINIWPTSVIVN